MLSRLPLLRKREALHGIRNHGASVGGTGQKMTDLGPLKGHDGILIAANQLFLFSCACSDRGFHYPQSFFPGRTGSFDAIEFQLQALTPRAATCSNSMHSLCAQCSLEGFSENLRQPFAK